MSAVDSRGIGDSRHTLNVSHEVRSFHLPVVYADNSALSDNLDWPVSPAGLV